MRARCDRTGLKPGRAAREGSTTIWGTFQMNRILNIVIPLDCAIFILLASAMVGLLLGSI